MCARTNVVLVRTMFVVFVDVRHDDCSLHTRGAPLVLGDGQCCAALRCTIIAVQQTRSWYVSYVRRLCG